MKKYKKRATIKNTKFFETFYIVKKDKSIKLSIRAWRFLSVILVHLLFVLSYYADIQILEGSISGSRIFGFHLADPFIFIQVSSAFKEIPSNLLIGAMSILGFYLFFSNRAFCSFVCPYGILSEVAEKLNSMLIAKKIIKKYEFSQNIKYIFWVLFISLSYFSGYLIFESFNVVGILSRFIIYGYSAAFFWLVLVLFVEILFSRRAWCRYICPIGTTYSLFPGLTKIAWDKNLCDHCQVCFDVCFVNDVLEVTKNAKEEKIMLKNTDCTLCGRCVDVCHNDALKIENILKALV